MERSIFDLQINTSQPIRGSCYNNAYFKLYHETIEVYRRRIVSVCKNKHSKKNRNHCKATRKAEADGIKFVKAAEAEGIKSIKNAEADDTVIRLKSLDAFAKAADGKATKIIIPSEIQGVAGLVSSVTEIAKDVKPTTKADK